MTPEQKAVVLDYVTEWQTDDEAWLKFEYGPCSDGGWGPCSYEFNPLDLQRADTRMSFRRKPRTITVTMPVPSLAEKAGVTRRCDLWFETLEDRDTALAAIREAMGDEQ